MLVWADGQSHDNTLEDLHLDPGLPGAAICREPVPDLHNATQQKALVSVLGSVLGTHGLADAVSTVSSLTSIGLIMRQWSSRSLGSVTGAPPPARAVARPRLTPIGKAERLPYDRPTPTCMLGLYAVDARAAARLVGRPRGDSAARAVPAQIRVEHGDNAGLSVHDQSEPATPGVAVSRLAARDAALLMRLGTNPVDPAR